jgi:hypothetical protein
MSIEINIVIGLLLLALFSVVANILLVWYTRQSIMRFNFIAENLSALRDTVGSYSSHLKRLYELDMFYGDETLKSLLQHTRDLEAHLETYEEFYNMFEEEGPDQAEEFEEEVEEAEDEQEGIDAAR